LIRGGFMVTEEYDIFNYNPYFDDAVRLKEMDNDLKPVERLVQRDLCHDITTDNLPENLEDIEMQIDRLKQRWSEFTYLIGQRLKLINDSRLFEQKGYQDFQTYVNIALKMSENNAYYYISIYEFFTEEQTRKAGSKLKLIIPILNKVKRDREIPDEIKTERLKDLRDEIYAKIFNKTYREAEKIISKFRSKYFDRVDKIEEFERYRVKSDRIVIFEDDKDKQAKLVKMLKRFYDR
jgi:hypothetical protein